MHAHDFEFDFEVRTKFGSSLLLGSLQRNRRGVSVLETQKPIQLRERLEAVLLRVPHDQQQRLQLGLEVQVLDVTPHACNSHTVPSDQPRCLFQQGMSTGVQL
jgi:RecJ-like exonuclease